MRAPVQRLADLQTREEALGYLQDAFRRQLEASIDAHTEPNTSISGDYSVRQAFNVLLSPTEQRAFFQQIVSDRRYWPRIKSLIGNPPFSFLLPEDEGLLRAGGICKNRANLHTTVSNISKAPDFGEGHFRDDAERTYRIINHDLKDASLPWQNIARSSSWWSTCVSRCTLTRPKCRSSEGRTAPRATRRRSCSRARVRRWFGTSTGIWKF